MLSSPLTFYSSRLARCIIWSKKKKAKSIKGFFPTSGECNLYWKPPRSLIVVFHYIYDMTFYVILCFIMTFRAPLFMEWGTDLVNFLFSHWIFQTHTLNELTHNSFHLVISMKEYFFNFLYCEKNAFIRIQKTYSILLLLRYEMYMSQLGFFLNLIVGHMLGGVLGLGFFCFLIAYASNKGHNSKEDRLLNVYELVSIHLNN